MGDNLSLGAVIDLVLHLLEVLWHTFAVFFSLGFLASLAEPSAAEVVVEALAALPAAGWELDHLSVSLLLVAPVEVALEASHMRADVVSLASTAFPISLNFIISVR